jgi:hypothetical protein
MSTLTGNVGFHSRRVFRAQSAVASPKSVPTLLASYRTAKQPDGKVRVYDVPVFGENERDFGDEVLGYDLKWLSTALKIDQKLRAENYRAPMHFGHHEPGVDRERAGEIELKGVGRRLFHGKAKWILFADLVFDTAEKFERFKREYVYRSVEISPEKPNEINSLALLASEAPYFRFPIAKQFTHAFRALPGGGKAFLWRFSMPAPITAAAAPPKEDVQAAAGSPAGFAPEKPEEKFEVAPAAAPEVNPNFAEYMQKCEARFARMEAALGIGGDEFAAPAGDEFAAEPDGDEAAPGIKKVQKAPPIVAAAALAEERGETLALRARVEQLERDNSEKELFAKYSAELDPWLTTPELKTELKTYVKHGEVAVKAFASGLKKVKPSRPRASEGAPVETVQDEPEVQKYAVHGPAKVSEARRLAAVWKASAKGHFVRNHDLATWLRHNVGEV